MEIQADNGFVPISRMNHTNRSKQLLERFAAKFQQEPAFYVRVPGRVNLIGEHIDYCGYSVCPMALEQDIMLSVSIGDGETLRLTNVDPSYEDYECDLRKFEISIGDEAPKWYQYFLCGVRGLLDVLPKETSIKGFNVAVSGIIPQSAGLSSSSALVSAAALSTSHVHNFNISKKELANLCARCERYIGTQGGGMDQAIAFLANEGCAKLIDFTPLRCKDVSLPPGAVFVIAHSLTRLNKAATADFNCRVVECRLAAQLIAKHQGIDWFTVKTLSDLQSGLKGSLHTMIALVKKILHESPYTKEEIVDELKTTSAVLDQTSLTPNTKHIESFKLHQRALHVFEEALRVQKFHEACNNFSSEGALETLGKLMSESHSSLRDLYECSHPQLDTLVEISQNFSLGARLTGAGWGGCAVALVTAENVSNYIDVLKTKFYSQIGIDNNLDGLVFATKPNAGAHIYVI
ncbi:hypothetical protein PPYR_10800 [Photinus pyralis]|uniref:Galactokinase n=2 Tax=Photinus pyralis TaxID=7054 RepID=A0A1Y1JUU6_PHOPY|nr:N-acetylgalactosamine kinase-like isoform X1 [Photinus pyralis]XP_031348153.1 N-acetylgalactosamine kinase-like isoform X1 [Photinus pyralis]KAB0796666.1 hypothetical protein PPYR_10727 [Photinus pyralis]KAB0796739.1 hypothetical protein PPYR_10800 [Photinus pyralis]